jgi:hypothetical protein
VTNEFGDVKGALSVAELQVQFLNVQGGLHVGVLSSGESRAERCLSPVDEGAVGRDDWHAADLEGAAHARPGCSASLPYPFVGPCRCKARSKWLSVEHFARLTLEWRFSC